MFTGLIEGVGTLTAVRLSTDGCVITVESPLAADLALGESVSVNGVCLTVTSAAGDFFNADVGPETFRVTNLAKTKPGAHLNLERAMRGDSRFGGHFVQGHVDGVGRLDAIREEGDARWLTVGYDRSAGRYLIPKGSIAVDGVSLTLAALRESQFDVMIVPFTWTHTNLADRLVGDAVNLEYDMVGKYVARAAELAGLLGQR